MSEKDIKISKYSKDRHVAISQRGIEIRYEGKPVTAEMAGVGLVYLLIDCSGSMEEGNKLDQAKRGAINFAKDAKAKGYSIGLIRFDSIATHLCEPQREISVLGQHLKSIEAGGTTNMTEAIRLAHQRLKDKIGAQVMVIVTDGMPNSEESALEAAKEAKQNRIAIITIGTDDADRGFLRKLASRTELGVKVSRQQLEQSIASMAKMLPSGNESKQSAPNRR